MTLKIDDLPTPICAGMVPPSAAWLARHAEMQQDLAELASYRCHLVSCASWYHVENRQYEFRALPDEAIVLPLSGGARVIEQHCDYQAAVGTVIFMPRWRAHRNVLLSEQQKSRHMLVIHCQWLNKTGSNLFDRLPRTVMPLPDDLWRQRLLALLHQWQVDPDGARQLAPSVLTNLLVDCILSGERLLPAHDCQDLAIAAALTEVQRGEWATLSVERLAAVAELSPSRFRQRFIQVMRCSPRDYLTSRRLEYAAELLHQTADDLTQITHAVGYSSVTHFHAAFKARFGATPERWRKMKLFEVA